MRLLGVGQICCKEGRCGDEKNWDKGEKMRVGWSGNDERVLRESKILLCNHGKIYISPDEKTWARTTEGTE